MCRLLYILTLVGLLYGCEAELESEELVEIKTELLENDSSASVLVEIAQEDSISDEMSDADRCEDIKDIEITDEIRQVLNTIYPDYRIARNSDFFDNYWCLFFRESESPYFTTGDFDGDGNEDYALMLTKNERANTLIVVLSQVDGLFTSMVVDSINVTHKKNADIKYTKFGTGLHKHKPDTVRTIQDSTYIFPYDFISLEWFEKGGVYYQWTGKIFKRVPVGC